MGQALYRTQLRDDDKSKGFSLIELLVVIGIMGILASIALIMLRGQHVIAMNSAALSDLNTIAKHEEGLYVDYDVYGTTHTNQTKDAKKKGKVITGPDAGYLVTNNNSSNPEYIEFRLSKDVSMVVASDNKNTLQSFVITTKHLNGDRRYCYDSEGSAIYYDNEVEAGTKLKKNKAISATLGSNDCENASMTSL